MRRIDRQAHVRHLVGQVRRLNRAVHGRLHNLHGDIGIAQLTALRTLADLGPMRATDLARELGLAASSVTGLLDRLEAEGYVERRRSQEDRREITVRLTESSAKMVSEARERIVGEIERMFAPLSDAEILEIERIIGKLIG